MVHGLLEISETDLYEGCIYGKQHKQSFPSGGALRASSPLDLVHTDICGPMQAKSFGGSMYFLLFTDDYIRISWVYFLKHKGEAFT